MPAAENSFTHTSSAMATAAAGMLALAVAMGIGRFAFTPVMPMMLQDAGLTLAGGGLLASANYIGYLLGAVSAMLLRVAPTAAIRRGLLAIGVTTLAMGAQLPLAGWIAMRLLAGIASAWVLISVSAWSLETLARHQRPILSSVVFSGVGVGIAAAGLLCIALIHASAASSDAWIALGLLSFAASLATWGCFRGTASGTVQPQAKAPYRWNAESIRLTVCYGLFGFGYIIPATFLPVMAKSALQDPTLFAWSWPVFGVAAALSTLAVAMVVRRLGSRGLWVLCHFVMAAGVALPVLWPGIVAIFLAALLVGGTFMVITLCGMQEARRVGGSAATALIAAMTAAFAAGQIAGPLCVAYVLKGSDGFSESLLLAALLLVLSGFALARTKAGNA